MQEKKNEKKILRDEMLRKRNGLELQWIATAEKSIIKKLFSGSSWKMAQTIMLYMDYRKEVPTEKILKQLCAEGKKAVLPYTSKDFTIIPYVLSVEDPCSCLRTSSMGIKEPDPARCEEADPEKIDLILIPGVAFDNRGNRLGFGKGCYDRFLPKLRPDVPKIALAYDFQTESAVPADAYDVKMDLVITENRIIGECL